jgi:hypothetical protein
MRRWLHAAAYVALAVLATWPMVLSPMGRLLGDGDVDVWNHAWGPWWWAASLADGQLPWQTELLRYPEGGVLWFIDPLMAGVATPLVPLLGVAGAYNLALLLDVAFTAWAARRLALAFGCREAPSWVASVAAVGSAWLACELHNGITEATHLGFVALALAWGHEACKEPSLKAWAKAGLGVGLATAASPYLGLGTGIALLVRGLPHIRFAWAGGLVALVTASPVLAAMKGQLHAVDAIVKHPPEMNAQLALHNAVDPRTFVQPFGFRSVDLSAEGFEHSMYLGLFALGLALYSRRWAWWPSVLACLVFALGPYLYLSGSGLVVAGGGHLRLPWWLIQSLAPGLAVTHPLRLAVPALMLICGLAAVGAWRLTRIVPERPRPFALALIGLLVGLDGFVLSGSTWPHQTADASLPAVYEGLARNPGDPVGEGILDLPTDAGETMGTSRYLYWQAAHWRPIPYAPDARASTSALIDLRAFRRLAALSPRRGDEAMRLDLMDAPDEGNPAAELVGGLLGVGIRWIVVHTELDPDGRIAPTIDSWLGPGVEVGTAVRWDLKELEEAAIRPDFGGGKKPGRAP